MLGIMTRLGDRLDTYFIQTLAHRKSLLQTRIHSKQKYLEFLKTVKDFGWSEPPLLCFRGNVRYHLIQALQRNDAELVPGFVFTYIKLSQGGENMLLSTRDERDNISSKTRDKARIPNDLSDKTTRFLLRITSFLYGLEPGEYIAGFFVSMSTLLAIIDHSKYNLFIATCFLSGVFILVTGLLKLKAA